MSNKKNAPAVCIDTAIINLLPWINAKAWSLTRHREEAADLAQETILRALQAKSRFNTGMALRPWLLTIMVNIYATQYTRRKLVLFCRYSTAEEYGKECYPVYETADLLQRVIDMAKVSVSVCCAVAYAEGYDYAELAEKFNIPIGTVRSRIYTARKQILPRLRNAPILCQR